MGLLSGMKRWVEKTMGGEVLHDFGKVYDAVHGTRRYTIEAKLRSGEAGKRCVELLLKESWANVKKDPDPDLHYIHLYFKRFTRIIQLFEDARRRIEAREGPSGETFGVIRNTFMKLTKEQIVHNYGRIDDHPTQSKNRQIEMALMRRDTDQTYHFHLALRKQEYFAWPAQPLIEAIKHIVLEVQHV